MLGSLGHLGCLDHETTRHPSVTDSLSSAHSLSGGPCASGQWFRSITPSILSEAALWDSFLYPIVITMISHHMGLHPRASRAYSPHEQRQHFCHRCDQLTVQAKRINPRNNTSFSKGICTGLQFLSG